MMTVTIICYICSFGMVLKLIMSMALDIVSIHQVKNMYVYLITGIRILTVI